MPFHGALTDLQVWSRALAGEEVVQWLDCAPGMARRGNFLVWDTLNLTISGLDTHQIDESEICSYQ